MSSTETKTQEGYSKLAGFLRQHPSAIDRPASEVAKEAGVSVAVVEQVLSNSHTMARQNASRVKGERDRRPFGPYHKFKDAFVRWTSRPILFVVVTLLIATVINTGIGKILPSSSSAPSGTVSVQIGGSAKSGSVESQRDGGLSATPRDIARVASQSAVFLLVLVLHFACYYRWGMARVALLGGGAFWVVCSFTLALSMVFTASDAGWMALIARAALLSLAFLVIATVYAGVGVVFSLAGAFVRVRRADAEERSRTRQDLLQRLFDIEERLEKGPDTAESRPRNLLNSHPVVHKIRRSPFLWAAVSGFIVGVLQVIAIGFVEIVTNTSMETSMEAALVSFAFSLVAVTVQFGICFFSGGLRRSLLASLLFTSGALASILIPFGPFGPEWLSQQWPWGITASYGYGVFIGLLAGVAAKIEERASRDRLLSTNDPAQLLAEMVEIQRKLKPTAQRICVMVVDAAKSSQMKAEADPLVAEWSFREYQKLIARVSAKFGGSVHSTAGDGAVVSFSNARDALQAARSIQTEIIQFNHKTNKLKARFRLRIGLHAGNIAGDIDKVEFTEVIDIAAHAESRAPIGGISMTDGVASELADEQLARLDESVDGHALYLAMNPSLDP